MPRIRWSRAVSLFSADWSEFGEGVRRRDADPARPGRCPNRLSATIENLLTPTMLDVLAQAAAAADQPYSWAADHIVHAIDHLGAQEYVHAWPPRVIGVEGCSGRRPSSAALSTPPGAARRRRGRRGRGPRNAIDVFAILGMNERVRRFLTRFAFGGEANAFRHGRLDPIGRRHECLVWLVALAAWIDGWGWPRPA
jgi:hypothetical protein